MAFRLVDGKIAKVDGKFSFRKANTISFSVDNAGFPISNAIGHGQLAIESKKPISIVITDGINNYPLTSNQLFGSRYRLSITSDGNTIDGFNTGASSGFFGLINFVNPVAGTRTISISFQNPKDITVIRLVQFNLYGAIPDEIKIFKNLEELQFNVLRQVTSFPTDLSALINLISLNLRIISPLKFDKIPDSFFNLDLKNFQAASVFDCSDEVSSNLFKINQWTNMLNLDLRDNDIDYLPNDWQSMANTLNTLRIDGNNYTDFPPALALFPNINRLDFGINNGGVRQPWFDLSLWNDLSIFYLYGDVGISDISTAWNSLFSLSIISNFDRWINNTVDFDTFINQFYTLCITNGSITNNSGEFATYPNRFRNISWGEGSLVFTGSKVAPAGYVQGVSNGTPSNEGEKVYVLQNQYGHTVTHA